MGAAASKLTVAIVAAALVAGPLAAQADVEHLAGVADRETAFIRGPIEQVVKGKNDVFFVRDATARWYRLALNVGCLSQYRASDTVAFQPSGGSSRIDRWAKVLLPNDGLSCRIESIRASQTPPQMDSKSKVTLD